VALGKGKYLAGCPDLVENIDILASLRGSGGRRDHGNCSTLRRLNRKNGNGADFKR
jgi:hypothetical protein